MTSVTEAVRLVPAYQDGRLVAIPAGDATPATDFPYRPRPVPSCPYHAVNLDGGPVQFWCPAGHGVMAAELTAEVA